MPKQLSGTGPQRPVKSGTNLFLIVTLAIFGLSVLVALLTFAYDKLLVRTLAGKQAELSAAQAKIDENTIDEFVRLRDRLTAGKDLLANHIVLSQFFDDLESLTLQNVRFADLKLAIANDHTAKLEMNGTARSFNALAAQSNALAAEKRIKRAIFSGISLKDGVVTFKMTADIDPRLIVETATAPARAQQQEPPTVTEPSSSTTPIQ